MSSARPRRLFITGASGFVGRALAERYRARGWEVGGVDRVADEHRGVVGGDVARPGPWQRAMAGSGLVIHTAAVVSNAASHADCWALNAMGTRLALDGAVAAGAERFVHLSSIRVFSDLHAPDGVDERHPVRTDGNPYVDSKVAAEQIVLQAHAAGEIPCTVIRPGDVYGPRSRPWTALPVAAIKAGRFVLPDRGRGVFSPVFIENLIDGLVLAAEAPRAAGRVYILGDGLGVSCREFFAHYVRMLGRRGPVCLPTAVAVALARAAGTGAALRGRESEVNAATMRYFTRRGTYSIARARAELGYVPAVGLEEGMARTESWLRAEGML